MRPPTVFWFAIALCAVADGAPPTEHNTRTFRNALNQQGMQSILQSIEERLRNLDQIYALRYTSRSDLSMDQCIRKIEQLETKLARIESLMDVQMEKISENMSSKNFKDDITKDQIFRKIDSVYERINHKIDYVEGKLDMDILKLQSKIESAITKVERLDHSIGVRQADIEAEVTEGIEIMESVKSSISSIDNKIINTTKNTIENLHKRQMETITVELINMTTTISRLESNLNNSFVQYNNGYSGNSIGNEHESVVKIIHGYEDKITNYGNKMTNMYNELWRKSTDIEKSVKTTEQIINTTRKNFQENMNKLFLEMDSKRMPNDDQNDATLEIIIDSFTNTLHRKFTDIGRKLESNFQSVMLAQNLFLESCHRIQMDESQLENKISLVLEKLLDSFVNKSAVTFREIQNMEELIKSHDSHMYRSLSQNTNTIIKLSEKTSEDRKKIESILSTIKRDVGSSLITIQDALNSENEDNMNKFDTISNILQVLQEQINDLDNKINEDNMNYNSKQILEDILVQTKALLNKDTFTQQFNASVSENKDSLSMIENLMKNIFYILNNIESKMNKSYLDYIFNKNDLKSNTHRFAPKNIKNRDMNEIILSTNKKDVYPVTQNGTAPELIDVVLKILPENNSTYNTAKPKVNFLNEDIIINHNTEQSVSFLRRFNYTTIRNENEKNKLYDFKYNNTERNGKNLNVTKSHSAIINDIKIESNLHNITNNDTLNGNYTKAEVEKGETQNFIKPLDFLTENVNSTEHNLDEKDKHEIKLESSDINMNNSANFVQEHYEGPFVYNLTNVLLSENEDMHNNMFNLSQLQDSGEYDFRNITNDYIFGETASDLPDIQEYDEDYDE